VGGQVGCDVCALRRQPGFSLAKLALETVAHMFQSDFRFSSSINKTRARPKARSKSANQTSAALIGSLWAKPSASNLSLSPCQRLRVVGASPAPPGRRQLAARGAPQLPGQSLAAGANVSSLGPLLGCAARRRKHGLRPIHGPVKWVENGERPPFSLRAGSGRGA